MPQVTCPNCGMTINLENRKGIDFDLITNAAKKEPRTFTELLHITRLSRKTLSLRLKALCANGTIVKSNGMYKLNGISGFGNNYARSTIRLSRARVLSLIALLLFSSTSGYVLATLLAPQPEQINQEPVILGDFAMTLDVNNVKDLYAWQAVIIFNSSELKVLEVLPGDFLKIEYPFFVSATDSIDNGLLLAGTLCGDVHGNDGSGELATITFGYFVDNYKEPTIVLKGGCFETKIIDSTRSPIDLNESTMLTLTTLQK